MPFNSIHHVIFMVRMLKSPFSYIMLCKVNIPQHYEADLTPFVETEKFQCSTMENAHVSIGLWTITPTTSTWKRKCKQIFYSHFEKQREITTYPFWGWPIRKCGEFLVTHEAHAFLVLVKRLTRPQTTNHSCNSFTEVELTHLVVQTNEP